MIPVSVSEIRSWHVQHRDEGDWRWCAIDRLLDELDGQAAVIKRYRAGWRQLERTREGTLQRVWRHSLDLTEEPMAPAEEVILYGALARDHVDREENHG